MTAPPSTTRNTSIAPRALRWLLLVVPMALAVGSAVALFLWLLEEVTVIRQSHQWLLWLLPVAGAAIGFVYWRWGQTANAGTRLIIDEIHYPGGGIPANMGPLVFAATLVTHLFGGSAGREGTAVQMGGSLASTFERHVIRRFNIRLLQLSHVERQEMLQAGIAAGFGAVFGTPVTGAVFAIEVLAKRKFGLLAIAPCLLAAFVGHFTVGWWGIHHTAYPQLQLAQLGLQRVDALAIAKTAAAAVCFGLASWLFLKSAHAVSTAANRFIGVSWMRPVVGGFIVIAMTLLVGTSDYLGLGVTAPAGGVSIVSSFTEGGAHPFSWLLKLVFTAVTVGSGFKGGEVTPLFFVGATLGNSLAGILYAPLPLFAALGFVAVFGAAANTPIACALMGLELFGADAALYFVVACLIAHLCSGRHGLYTTHPAAEKKAQPDGSPNEESPHRP